MRTALALLLPSILLLSAASSSGANAEEKKPTRVRQYQHVEGKSLKDYIDEGYELKGVLPGNTHADAIFYLQKGTNVAMCEEFGSFIGGKMVSRTVSCSDLIQPVPY